MQRMKLAARIKRLEDGRYKARSNLFDQTEFDFIVRSNDIALNEESTGNEVTGFVFVTQLALQDTRVYIELPDAGSIVHGNKVLVHKYSLHNPNSKIEDFLGEKFSLTESQND